MRVGIVIRSHDASARVRALQHVPGWERAGAEVRVVAWDAPRGRVAVTRRTAEVVALGGWADVVLLQKPVLPTVAVRALAAANRRLVVDLDDATWVSAADRTVSAARAARVVSTLEAAAGVVAGSDHLADLLRALHPAADPVVLRPSVTVGGAVGGGSAAGAPLVAGWIGSPGNFADLTPPVREALAAVVADATIELRIVSSEPPDLGVPATFVRWSSATEAEAVAAFDVGLMPLADDPRSAGRCGYKAIQSMAAAQPVVASPVGCGPELVRPGETGYLASSPREWQAALRLLAGDPRLRARLGVGGMALVAAEADAAVVGPALLGLLADVASRPRWWGRPADQPDR